LQVASSPADVARQSDITFAMLSDPPAAVQVATGPGGIVEGKQRHTLQQRQQQQQQQQQAASRLQCSADRIPGGCMVFKAGSIVEGGQQRTSRQLQLLGSSSSYLPKLLACCMNVNQAPALLHCEGQLLKHTCCCCGS
jgi:hypothetical protein